ncbi:MAG: Ig-like domain-containing protein [Gemmatimonadetes bacterium]|nr:Ig-like domain-containing protein [Gemmatimonadota bacterium]
MPLFARTSAAALIAVLGLAACEEKVVTVPATAVTLSLYSGGTPPTLVVNSDVPTPPSVRATDSAGEPVAGARVLFVVTRGNGAVAGGDVTTGPDGIAASTSWRYGRKAGPQEVSAAIVNSTSGARVTFSGTAQPGATVALSVTPAALSLSPLQTRQLTVNASDAFGNATGSAVAATFTSQDTAIARVSSTGLVTAVDYGSTTISATFGARSAVAIVTVGTRPLGTNVVNSTLSSRPYSVAIAPQGTLYAVRVDVADVTRFDLPSTTSTTATTLVTPAYDIAFLPSGTVAYAVNVPGGVLSVVDRSTNAVLRTIGSIGEPYRIRASSDGAHVYVSNSTGDVHRISTVNDARTTISPGGVINGLALNEARGLLYASTYGGQLHEISLSTFAVTRSVNLGGQMQGMAVSANGATIYVANETNGLQVVDASTLVATTTIATLAGAFDVAITLDGIELYVTRPQASVTDVLTVQTLNVVRSITGGTPRRMAFAADGRTLVIANEGGWLTFVR